MSRKIFFILSAIMLVTISETMAQKTQKKTTVITVSDSAVRPKLLVNIVVSSLRYDYLIRLGDRLTEFGIKKMVKGGAVCSNANFNYMHTSSCAGLATIMTGSNPDSHGIISDTWQDFTTNQTVRLENDAEFNGLGSDDENNGRVSPRQLVVNSVGDQLKRYNDLARVVSVGVKPSTSVVAGGLSADMAFWFDTHKGNWLTSTYYTKMTPEWLQKYNKQRYVDVFAATKWAMSRRADTYLSKERTAIAVKEKNTIFTTLSATKNFSTMIETPSGNDMLFDFAKQAIIYENLGRDNVTDMITICVEPFGNISRLYGPQSIEAEDAIYSLDINISDMLSFLHAQFGMDNVLVVLTADHGCSDIVKEDVKSASGKFNVLQFKAIVGGFLNAQLGTNDWITDYNDQQLYLNRRLIYEKGLKLAEIQEMVAGFAIQFRGVSNVMTATALQNASFNKGVSEKMQNSYFPRRSGDLLINLLPGWIEEHQGTVSSSGSSYRYDTHVPLLWYGAGVVPTEINRSIDMRDIAPTLSKILKVPVPEASSGQVINEVISSKYDN